MKAIYLYAPPATGKLTIAREICKITGFKLIHNHLFTEILLSVFESKNKHYWKLWAEFKERLAQEAAKAQVPGIVFTGVYDGQKSDDRYIKSFVTKMKKRNIDIHFVQLTCSQEARKKRIASAQRKKDKKTTTLKRLKERMHEGIFSKMPFNHLTLDTTTTSAEVNAKKIVEYYTLKNL